MPRAPKNKPLPVGEAIALFAEHHIVAVRKARRSGEIIAVKHVAWGWIHPRDYYLMQKVHEILPLLEKVVEGGYRAKSSLWGSSLEVSVLGNGVKIPMGPAIIAGAFAVSALDGIQAQELANFRADDLQKAGEFVHAAQLAYDNAIPLLKQTALDILNDLKRQYAQLVKEINAQRSEASTFQLYSILDLVALVVPFGELFLIWRGVLDAANVAKTIVDTLKSGYLHETHSELPAGTPVPTTYPNLPP